MVSKQCPECKQNSYSASEKGEWLCPNCGKDLTNIKTKESMKKDK
jgi:uncharacterized Zn finger protein (UPF0148 family)